MSTKKREDHHAVHAVHSAGKRATPIESPVPVVQTFSDDERSRMIQIRAYGLWEQAGKPDGDAARVQFWCAAEEETMLSHGREA